MIRSCVSHGNTIAYRVSGEGEPLVLIMGLGSAAADGLPHIRAWEKHFKVIAVDNLGMGRSDKPERESYSIEEMAEDVIAVMDAESIASAHVNGISMGGAMAQRIAVYHGERVRSLILTDTFPHMSAFSRNAIENLMHAKLSMPQADFDQFAQWMVYSPAYQEQHCLRPEYGEGTERMPIHGYIAQCRAALGYAWKLEKGAITCPTLIAAGDQDMIIPMELTNELISLIPRAEVFVAGGRGHCQHWEDSETYNRVTLDFLLRHSGAARYED